MRKKTRDDVRDRFGSMLLGSGEGEGWEQKMRVVGHGERLAVNPAQTRRAGAGF